MTDFQLPLRSGSPRTGNDVSDDRGDVMLVKQVSLNVSARSVSRTLPPNAKIHRGLVLVNQAVSSSGLSNGGVDVRVGTTANPNKYGSIRVSGVATYEMALSAACISADGQIVIDVTAVGTAADWGTSRDFAADVHLVYFAKSL